MHNVERGKTPVVYKYDEAMPALIEKIEDDAARKRAAAFIKRLEKNMLTFMYEDYMRPDWVFVNFHMSSCYSCEAYTVWVHDKIVYPLSQTVIEPHEMMPPSVKADFEEAGSIVNVSPRGAAALARLCIQKLMKELGEEGKNINKDIGELVKKGLEVEVQQALDIVRVIGNHAVHPGQIDLEDDKQTALTLLALVNMIVERRIATLRKLESLYAGLPPGALAQIQKRDSGSEPS